MVENKDTGENELNERIYMKQILVAFSQKYDGNFSKVIHAVASKEKLTDKEIYDYVNQVDELTVTILSKKYPEALKLLPDPPIVMYYDGNLELMDSKGVQFYIPVGNEEYKRVFFALENNENEMDYCVGVEREEELAFVIETMIKCNPQFNFVDYSRRSKMSDELNM